MIACSIAYVAMGGVGAVLAMIFDDPTPCLVSDGVMGSGAEDEVRT